jgi:glycosyltransferase involved in cell wall biosynthesis
MLKVLHLISSFNRGGIEMWLLSMLAEIPRNECAMDICCKGLTLGPLVSRATDLGANVWHCPLGPDHYRFMRKLKRILIEEQYHVLHNHLHVYSGFPVWLAHQLQIPVITSFHNTQFLVPETGWTRLPVLRQLRSVYGSASISYALRQSEMVTGCSKGVVASLGTFGVETLEQRSQILYYGTALPHPATSKEYITFRQSFGWSEDTPVILHVGRLVEQKNQLGLLAIFQQVLENLPQAKLLMVGEGPLRPLVQDAIACYGLSDSVYLLGFCDDVPALMSKCDVFLLPSHFEGFPMVAVEATAAGLPLVGSRIPGLIEAVQDGETALLHLVDDTKAMANSVVRLLTDRDYARLMAEAGKKWVQNRYSLAASATKLLEIYAKTARIKVSPMAGIART